MVRQTEKESNTSKLHFAAFIRVSTEQQEKTGESLRTQKTEIENAVEQMGGKIISFYGGQEHATSGYEKKEIDRLLVDAQKNTRPFNAVIVTNADRWSRDNEKSRRGLDIFKEQGIRFFIGTFDYDLVNPEHRLILGLSAEIGQFFASQQKKKSLNNRIHRAKRGIPTAGKLPYGRTFNPETEQWEIDKQKQDIIQEVAGRYLAGEKLPELAAEFKMNHSNLHKILTKRSGDTWGLKFNSDDLKIHEKVEMKIPPLLPDNVIAAILKKTEAGKTYEHGQNIHSYLLSRMVFCKHCGYAMFGQTNHNGQRYYRHAHTKRERECNLPKTWINADEIEDIVMSHLFECFGNPVAVQKAIEKAIPNLEKIREYQKQLERIGTELNKIKLGRERIIHHIADGDISREQTKKELDELKQKESGLQVKQQQLRDSLENNPSPEKIKEMSKKVSTQFGSARLSVIRWCCVNDQKYNRMTYKEKRALAELIFGGKTLDGRRMGVYIEWDKTGWKFDIHGHLMNEEGLLPLSDSREKAYFGNFESAGWKQKELVTKYASY